MPLRHGVWAPGEPHESSVLLSQNRKSWSCGGLHGLSVGQPAATTYQLVCGEWRWQKSMNAVILHSYTLNNVINNICNSDSSFVPQAFRRTAVAPPQ